MEIWEHVLSRKPSSLGDELWMVYEQVLVASLDCARLDVAQECLQALHARFPKSHRVLKLEAYRLEAIGKYDDAVKIYDSLSDKDEANAIYWKRKIAILKAQGKTTEAIKELNSYLQVFLNDNEAWMYLSDLYLSIQDYSKAAFCFEELLLSNPHNHLFHQRYAEIKYTQGGLDNVELARCYYLKALELNPNNMRAMFGVSQCCSVLLQQGKQRKKELAKAAAVVSGDLLDKYSAEGALEDMPWVEGLLSPAQYT